MWFNGNGDINNFDVFDFSLQNNMQQETETASPAPAPVTVSI